ncbi:MAG: DinB family protein [Bryobacterales bacterium]|jgi:hypothetical protein|nr:DinB family protein [Bryobacterales bacterium]
MARQVVFEEIEVQSLEGLARFQRLVNGLTQEQLLWRPAPASWSIAECVQHLNFTLAIYRSPMRLAFERERQNAPLAPAAFRVGFLASKFLSILEPPYRVKVKAPTSVLPSASLEPKRVIEEFVRTREEYLAFGRDAARVDMSSIRFKNPAIPVWKISLTEGLLIMLAHDRRHLWQAENVRKGPDFPQGG